MILAFFAFLVLSRSAVVNISIVDQINPVEPYNVVNLANRVQCQNITDIYLSPLLIAADDAIVPPLTFFQSKGIVGGLNDCSALTFSFSAIRTRSFSNPRSLTIVFFRSDGQNGTPGSVIYQKTLPWATNDYMWQRDYIGLPWTYDVTFQWNEVGDDGVTRLNFRDVRLMAPQSRFWVAFYCTVPREPGAGFRQNAMYWVTLNNKTNSSSSTWASDFVFRDAQNLLGNNFVNWTTARVYEASTGIIPATNNLAWSLYFTCNTVSAPSFAPVEVPTPSPTSTPTAPSAIETGAPTRNETNSSEVNVTTSSHVPFNGVAVALAIVIPLTILTCGACLCWLLALLKRRRIAKRKGGQTRVATRAVVGSMGVEYDQFREYNMVALDDSGMSTSTSTTTKQTILDGVYDSMIATTTDEDEVHSI